MTYIFIETRDPFESRDTRFVEEMATALKERGDKSPCFCCRTVFSLRKFYYPPMGGSAAVAGWVALT